MNYKDAYGMGDMIISWSNPGTEKLRCSCKLLNVPQKKAEKKGWFNSLTLFW